MFSQRSYLLVLSWVDKYLQPGNLIIGLSILIGLAVGMAAVGLKTLLHFFETSVLELFPRYTLFFLPLIGIFLTAAINRSFFKESPREQGLPGVLYAISRQNAFIRRSLMYSQLLLSSVTLAFGGSVGFEAPMVVTGSAWGSNIARFFRLDFKHRTLMIGCGTAAGISAIFNAPIAGVIFAMEVILPEISTARFIPILISAAMGNLLSSLFIENEAIFRVQEVFPFGWGAVLWVLILGMIGGFYAALFSKAVRSTGRAMRRFRKWWHKALAGGLLLGTLIYFLPPLYGEGYIGIRSIINADAMQLIESSRIPGLANHPFDMLLFILALLLFKPIAAAVTVEAGGVGGKFAPSVVAGGYLGFLFAFLLNTILPNLQLSVVNFTLFGMCAVLSGVMHAPLTAIFLIAEITGTYDIIVPLMLVSAMAYFTKVYFQPLSLVAGKLLLTGDLIHNDKDRLVLHGMELTGFIEKDIRTIETGKTLGELVDLIPHCKRNIFPVLDGKKRLLGIILLDDIRHLMFDQSKYDEVTVDELMKSPPAEVELGSTMEEVMQLFDTTKAWNLPVVKNGAYLGFISKSSIFSSYRAQLKGTDA